MLTPESADNFTTSFTITPESDEVVIITPMMETPSPTSTKLPTAVTPTMTITPEISPSPEQVASPTPTSENGDCSVNGNRGFESQVIRQINAIREENGLRAFSEQSQLTQAARLHSEDMACNQFFSHVSDTYGDLEDRIIDQGYDYSAIGENIAAGYSEPEEVVEGWMDSLGHRENILNPQYTQVGVGFIYVEESPYGNYWTIIFGRP